jgi:hypothetical protein
MADQYFGKYTGIVKDNKDEAKLGHLKVSVPAIFPDEELVEATPALPYGYFFVPDVETKIWVEFEGGDPTYPLWTGIQYIAGEWAKDAEADPPTKRVMATPSGHLVIFDDTGGSETIEIRHGTKSHKVVMDSAGIAIEDGANSHKITLASGKVTVEAAPGSTLSMTAGTTKAELSSTGATVDAGPGMVTVSGSLIKLGRGALPALCVGDMGIGNLGAPVVIPVSTNMTVLV